MWLGLSYSLMLIPPHEAWTQLLQSVHCRPLWLLLTGLLQLTQGYAIPITKKKNQKTIHSKIYNKLAKITLQERHEKAPGIAILYC